MKCNITQSERVYCEAMKENIREAATGITESRVFSHGYKKMIVAVGFRANTKSTRWFLNFCPWCGADISVSAVEGAAPKAAAK